MRGDAIGRLGTGYLHEVNLWVIGASMESGSRGGANAHISESKYGAPGSTANARESRVRTCVILNSLFWRINRSAGLWVDTSSTLEGKHPAGVLRWQGADFVQLFEFVGGELKIDCGDVVFELVEAFCSDDDGGDHGL